MHDIRAIRENPDAFDAALKRRGDAPMAAALLAIDEKRRVFEDQLGRERERINSASKFKGRPSEKELNTARNYKELRREVLAQLEDNVRQASSELKDMLARIANLPADDVPDGADEDDNVEVSRWGTPRDFDFEPKEHFEIPAVTHDMDFETAAKTSGSRFVMLKGAVARIHRALAQFMLDTHVDQNGLREVNAPVLVTDDAMYGTDKLPKFGEESYRTEDGKWLVPTSEVTLTYSVAGDILDAAQLPIRLTAHTLCFRSEAGSAGRDTAGMLRQHQFEKVEMVSITHPDASDDEQKRMLRCAEKILETLDIPYRTVILCTGDLGFGARRTYDIEAWLPGQNSYREISSVSTTGDFQARRMNARFKPADGGKPQFVHTLNGSGLAVGRCLIAVLENGQQADGSVQLPAALAPYLGGKTTLTADGKLA